MRTIQQIVQDHIARSAALANDPIAFAAMSEITMNKMASRMHDDPSLTQLTTHYAQGLAQALRTIPAGLHAPTIQSLLIQVVMEWEDIHAEYGDQLKPNT